MNAHWPEEENIDNNLLAGEPIHCTRCQSYRVVKRGVVKGNQRYECKKCLLKFVYKGL
jgi:transposase-like protein